MVKTLISVVSPVYGCRECLKTLTAKVQEAFEGTDLDWELILVDDCGPDEPWDTIKDITANNSNVRGIKLAGNHGQHLAIWAGLEDAKGDWAVILDCDMQDDPSIIPALYEQAKGQKVDSVVVERGDWVDSRFRRLVSKLFYQFIRLITGFAIPTNIGNYGIYSRKLVDILLSFGDREVFLPIMVVLAGLPQQMYKLDRSKRTVGESSYNLARLIKFSIAIIVRFSDRPLKISIVLGFFFSSVSMLVAAFVFVAWHWGAIAVPGWASTILSIWFLAGLILSVLGIQGVYLGRIFKEVQQRPRIIVEKYTQNSV